MPRYKATATRNDVPVAGWIGKAENEDEAAATLRSALPDDNQNEIEIDVEEKSE